jgi:outer membrane protein assembly factor BamB
VKVGESRYGPPIVVGGKVFLLCEPDKLVCLDADSGKALWEKANGADQLPDKPEVRPPSSDTGNTTPTPISACYDLDGNRKWIQYVSEPSTTEHGRSCSPMLVGDKLIATLGMLTALDTATGKVVWKNEKVGESYGTPVAGKVGDVDVVVDTGGTIVRTKDGVTLAKRVGSATYASPITAGDIVYYLGEGAAAAQLSLKSPDAIAVKKLWTGDTEGEFFASGVVFDGIAYAVSNQGMLYALDAKDGKELWKQMLEISNASGKPGLPPGNLYPSLAVAGKLLYVSNDQGETLVLQPGKEYKELKKNRLNDGSGANMFFAGKRIYVRGGEKLYCLGTK